MGWAILFLVLVVLVIILSISLITDSVQLCIKNPIATIPTEEYSKLLERFYVADISRSTVVLLL